MRRISVSFGRVGRPRGRRTPNIKYIFRRYGTVIFFVITMLCGLAAGSICSGGISKEVVARLDLLFTTNLPDRISGGAAEAFCASFASNFLFFTAAFLLGLCLPGIALLPPLAFFNGFGIGVSAGFLISSHGLRGLGFYLIVILPGVLVFGTALVGELRLSFGIWRQLCRSLFSRQACPFGDALRQYALNSLRFLIISLAASAVDTVMWALFAGIIRS